MRSSTFFGLGLAGAILVQGSMVLAGAHNQRLSLVAGGLGESEDVARAKMATSSLSPNRPPKLVNVHMLLECTCFAGF